MSLAPASGAAATPSTTAAPALWSREVLIAGAIVSCAPLVLLAFNRDWFFTAEGFLDPWHYVGFFREYLNPDFSRGAYKLGRLPWILSGFLVNRAFSPLAAAYVLHALYLCATNLALFAGLYLLLGRLGLAAIVTTLFGFYTNVHGSGGWDYHNTGAGAFYLLAVALLASPAAIAARRHSLILAGVAIALAVHSNIMLVNFLPVLAFIHLTSVRSHTGAWPRLGAVIAQAGWALLGAVLITALLGLVNWMVGREFVFFKALLEMVLNMLADPNQYQAPNVRPWSSGWAWRGRYLALPAAMWLASLAVLMLKRRAPSTPADRVGRSLVLQFAVMTMVFIAWQLAGQTALDWESVAYPLSLAAILALAGLFVSSWPEACERHWLRATIATAIVCALCLSGALDFIIEPLRAAAAPFISVVGAIVFLAALLPYLTSPSFATMAVFVVVFALGNSLVTRADRYSANDACKIQPAIYQGIVDGATWIGSLDPTYTRVRTWFDESEQMEMGAGCEVGVGRLASSITAMSFVPYVTPPFPMPAIDAVPEPAVRSLVNEDLIFAVISTRADALEGWTRRLDAMGLAHQEFASHTVPLLGPTFTMHAWRITEHAPHDISFAAPLVTITKDTKPELNVYGTPKGRIRVDGDRLEVQPTDARDHVAYPFVQLPAHDARSWARVVVEGPTTTLPSCRLTVQDQDFKTLAALGCSSATRYVRVPQTARGIRVSLADTKQQAFLLPRRIEVALSVSGP